jgi:hypothetical protein
MTLTSSFRQRAMIANHPKPLALILFALGVVVPVGAVPTPALSTASGQESSVQVAEKPATETSVIGTSRAFLAGLSKSELTRAQLDYEGNERVQWHFIPKQTRKGLPMMDMSDAQMEAASEVLRSLLSRSGEEKARSIMALEAVLLELEGEGSRGTRNPLKYYFTIFGQPAADATWGISIEGHHLSLNFSLEGEQIVDSTPQFFASNPAVLQRDFNMPERPEFIKGFRLLDAEEQLGFDLLTSLDEKQRAIAVLSETAPEEIRWAGEAQSTNFEPRGIQAKDLTQSQQTTLRALIDVYVESMLETVAETRYAAIKKDGFENIYFAWAGADEPGIGHYYSVQGASFIIEFINVQADADGNPANHVHCVWRDLTGDFHLPIRMAEQTKTD